MKRLDASLLSPSLPRYFLGRPTTMYLERFASRRRDPIAAPMRTAP